MPHAIGDKHIPIRCPRSAGRKYVDYKGFHFQVLLDLVDDDYKFIWHDIVAGSSSHGQTF